MQKQTINWLFLLWAALILALTTFFVGNAMVQSNKNNQQSSQGITNTISVMGEGKASVAPDMLVINVSISELAATTELAQKQANQKVTKVNDILNAASIAQKDIQTASVNVYPEYDRSDASWRKLLWYRATQSITIKVSWDNFWQKGADIVDKIWAIGAVNVDNTYFDLKDKNASMQWARDNAFADAKAKAEQLAKAGGVMLGKPVMITDNNISYTPGPIMYDKANMAVWSTTNAPSTPALSPGQTEVTVDVQVVYEIK